MAFFSTSLFSPPYRAKWRGSCVLGAMGRGGGMGLFTQSNLDRCQDLLEFSLKVILSSPCLWASFHPPFPLQDHSAKSTCKNPLCNGAYSAQVIVHKFGPALIPHKHLTGHKWLVWSTHLSDLSWPSAPKSPVIGKTCPKVKLAEHSHCRTPTTFSPMKAELSLKSTTLTLKST